MTMGAWGTGIFEDDTQLDWIEDEYTSGGVEAVRSALNVAGDTSLGDTLEADEGGHARAAAEVVAISFGAGHPALETDQSDMLAEHADDVLQDRDLISLALKSLSRLNGENSELKDLWSDNNDAAWTAEMEGLETRLRGLE